jgi:predicted glycogen debranching enzyme
MRAPLPTIEFGPEALGGPDQALSLECLIADGAGSYASTTAWGCNTRRYHGLLVAARRPGGDRAVLLSGVDERISLGGETIDLSTHEYPDTFHPRGHHHLLRFRLSPFPEWTYGAGGSLLKKEVFLLRGRAAVAIRYTLEGLSDEVEMIIRPRLVCRGHHKIIRAVMPFEIRPGHTPREVVVQGGPQRIPVLLRASGGSYHEGETWFHRVTYRRESHRGFPHEEEVFSPGQFRATLRRSRPFILLAGPPDLPDVDVETERRSEVDRLASVVERASPADPLQASLVLAADSFLVDPGHVIAGYPWFGTWGRDSFIALEGLALATGRLEEARSVLSAYADRIVDGIVPNILAPDPADDALNTIDAALWYVHAVSRYLHWSRDEETTREVFWPALQRIIGGYRKGTRFGIGIDDDGLPVGGTHQTQLTWMDARAGGVPVTPRHGKAVEICALWHNALCVAAEMADRYGGSPEEYRSIAKKAKDSFNRIFWAEDRGHLLDCIGEDRGDRRLRPNQILAVSLPHPVLDRSR